MSQWLVARVNIRSVNRELAKSAVEVLSRFLERNGVKVRLEENSLVEGYAGTRRVDFRIVGDEGGRTVDFGVSLSHSGLSVVGDEMYFPSILPDATSVAGFLRNAYVGVAVNVAMARLGYRLSGERVDADGVALEYAR